MKLAEYLQTERASTLGEAITIYEEHLQFEEQQKQLKEQQRLLKKQMERDEEERKKDLKVKTIGAAAIAGSILAAGIRSGRENKKR